MKKRIGKVRWFKDTWQAVAYATTLVMLAGCAEEAPLQYSSDPTIGGGPVTQAATAARDSSDNRRARAKRRSFDRVVSRDFIFQPSEGYYGGGTLKVGGHGSHFHVFDNSLTPPPNVAMGDTVTIIMAVEHDREKNELQFTFGPHGSQFDPPARIKIDYRVLGIDDPTLFYIDENGNYLEQTPDHINLQKKFMLLDVDHFSRYAVAWAQ